MQQSRVFLLRLECGGRLKGKYVRPQRLAYGYHIFKRAVSFFPGLKLVRVRQIPVASDRELKIWRNLSSPRFHRLQVGDLIERRVYLDKVKQS